MHRLQVLDTGSEPLFDDLARLAALEFRTPAAAISLVDRERAWAKAAHGLAMSQAPRDQSFCDRVVRGGEVLVIADASTDDRFRDNPFVRGEPGLRFYAGAPLVLDDGSHVGTLCVIDFEPRQDFTPEAVERLRAMAATVSRALTMRVEAIERERQARLADDRLRLLGLTADIAGVGTWSWDADSDRIAWSEETYSIHGRDPGQPPPDLEGVLAVYHPEDAPALRAAIQRSMREGVGYSFQGRLVRPDGAVRHIITKAQPRLDAAGRTVALYGTLQDVTELKLADSALRDSEARLRFLTEHMSDLVMRYDLEFRRLFVSASCRRYGYEPEDLVGEPGWSLNHPDDSPRMRRLIEDLLAGRLRDEDAHIEIRLRTKAGEWVWVDAAPNLVRDAQGELAEFVWVMRDISARKAAEAALAESEARYRMLAERASDIIIQYDADGVIRFASPAVSQLGYTSEQMVGTHVSAYGHPEDEVRMAVVRAGLKAGRPFAPGLRTERRVLCADGSLVWYEGSPSTIFDEQGRIVGAVTALRNVNARREMEDELRRRQAEAESAERSARLAAQIAGIGYWRFDLVSRERIWSPEVFQVHGVSMDSAPLYGAEALALYHPEDQEKLSSAWASTIETGEPLDFTGRLFRADDGRMIYLQTRAEAVREADGRIVALFGVVRDVTDEVEARLRIEESEARYRTLAEHATDIIFQYDHESRIQYVSPSIRQLGYEPEHMLGRMIGDYCHPDDSERTREDRQRRLRGEEIPEDRLSFRVLTADGGWVWMESSPSPVLDEAGQITAVVTVMRDVTVRRAMEEELRRKHAEAEAAAVAKSEFLANMSHEIRTPLTAVSGFAGLLSAMDGLPDRARTFVDRIIAGSQALLAIVNDILDFSRMEAGQIELNPQPFDPDDFVRQTVELVRNEAARKGLSLDLGTAGALPAQVLADSGRIGQVLLNLLNNAVKFTDRGGVRITLSHQGGVEPSLRLEVADTGVGISPEHSRRLFERFSQVDGSNTRQYGGAGLGLAISKGLVELMGGRIGVDSEPGRGSVFWFDIPAPPVEATASAPAAAEEPVGVGAARVLVVDDVQVNRELVSAILAPFGLQLTEAANGAEAVEAARSQPFDLIVMDLQMPVMDGFAATRAIRADSPLNRDTPILALSANVLPTHVEACRAAGMDDHVAKPINPAALLTKIAFWTDGQGRAVPTQ
ncbi:PAS domain S-box protein [Phenylobacterium montanum]|uniref:histidine kinase n=1 Tax=Phenylobacterium montanum TaxID=2823693 RepID=A0A975G137_9CAUL|nr:PAS domain S-box protein [Caulobacter sp. S6]QUD88659.1 PAS domain S-box protein [Caulobacter sp. S6]